MNNTSKVNPSNETKLGAKVKSKKQNITVAPALRKGKGQINESTYCD